MTSNDHNPKRDWGSALPLPIKTQVISAVCILVLISLLSRWADYYRRTPKIPSVGFWPIPYLGSWVAGIRLARDPVGVVKSGLAQSGNGIFRIATLSDEFVVVATKEKVAEYMKAPDSTLSMQDGANNAQQIPFTMGYGVAYRTYHNVVVRKQVTQKIPLFTPQMIEQIATAFDELIGSPEDFAPVSFYDTIAMTVAQTSNRIFVGGNFHQHKEYLQNATDYAQAVVISAEVLRLLPHWAKGFAVKFLPVTSCMRKAMKFLGPTVQGRLDGAASGNNKPDDLIQWLIDAAPPVEKTVYQIVERVMALNVASIHTTTMTFTAAIYTLAANPERYIDTLRSEVTQNLENGHITYSTIQKLVHIDSFLRESARFNIAGLAALERHAKKPFTFSDGTFIPAGAKIVSPSRILHRDPSSFNDPEIFDGFRFVRIENGVPVSQKPVITTGTDFHLFGHGRHPCPGRYFATHEMKAMFATLVMRYDMKLAPGSAPKETHITTMVLPDTTLKVLFKQRTEHRDM